jgi:hypothetical protein
MWTVEIRLRNRRLGVRIPPGAIHNPLAERTLRYPSDDRPRLEPPRGPTARGDRQDAAVGADEVGSEAVGQAQAKAGATTEGGGLDFRDADPSVRAARTARRSE